MLSRQMVRDPGILESLGVQNVDVAVIAVAENMEASITATMQVKNLEFLCHGEGNEFSSWQDTGENRGR